MRKSDPGPSRPAQDPPICREPDVKRPRSTISEPEQSEELCGNRSMLWEDEFKSSQLPSPLSKAVAAAASDISIERGINFKQNVDVHVDPLETETECQTDLEAALTELEGDVLSKVKNELRYCRTAIRFGSSQMNEEQGQRVNTFVLALIANVLREKRGESLANYFLRIFSGPPEKVCRDKLKTRLQQKYTHLFEGIPKAGKPTNLNEIYTELYVTKGVAVEDSAIHEVLQIETATRSQQEEIIMCQDIFKAIPEGDQVIRTVLMKGVAGIGKTVLTQKFSLDWAEGRANQDIQLLFPFTFRELNVLQDRTFSLVQLIHHVFPETREPAITHFREALLIFDGLDEFRLPLDFNCKVLIDADEATSLEVLLVNLIRGSLLPSARLWITTRPAAASQIPAECISMVTEVQGFTDLQKEQYFRRRFSKQRQATAIISHILQSKSLHVMCSIPVFCWITTTVMERIMKAYREVLLPKTLTEMYIHFLVVQVKIKNIKYDGRAEVDPHWSPTSKTMIRCLAKLAFEQLQEGKLIFYDSDLIQCGTNVDAAAVDSGVFTQIWTEEGGLYQNKVYCFIHLTVQEFLAALHVHVTFNETGVNLLCPEMSGSSDTLFYCSAVDQALQSPNGHLDLLLRFLLGLSLPSNQNLLQGFLKPNKRCPQEEIIEYIKEKVSTSCNPEKSINLFHCLNELDDCSLVEHIQQLMTSGSLSTQTLSPDQWSALAFILLSSNKVLEEFVLRRYSASEEVLLRLLSVVKASTKAEVNVCSLSERGCSSLSSILSCPSACLRELNLSNNNLKDPRVELLVQGLKTPTCPLEILRLCHCGLSERSCELLADVLTSPRSLMQLDLTNNDLMDRGVRLLCEGLKNTVCKLETLILSGCMVTEQGSSFLASALSSNPHHLKKLDLSYNYLSEGGEKLLKAQVENERCRLDSLSTEPSEERFLQPGLKKYSCHLLLDPTTANPKLKLSDDQQHVLRVDEEQSYHDNPERFGVCPQVLCSQHLSKRCYWEFEWSGWVDVGVCNGGIRRKGASDDCVFGLNAQSWCLSCSDGPYSISYNKRGNPLPISAVGSAGRVALYLDCPGGSLTLYTVLGDELVLLHKFSGTFREPLLTGFGLWSSKSSATLFHNNNAL